MQRKLRHLEKQINTIPQEGVFSLDKELYALLESERNALEKAFNRIQYLYNRVEVARRSDLLRVLHSQEILSDQAVEYALPELGVSLEVLEDIKSFQSIVTGSEYEGALPLKKAETEWRKIVKILHKTGTRGKGFLDFCERKPAGKMLSYTIEQYCSFSELVNGLGYQTKDAALQDLSHLSVNLYQLHSLAPLMPDGKKAIILLSSKKVLNFFTVTFFGNGTCRVCLDDSMIPEGSQLLLFSPENILI